MTGAGGSPGCSTGSPANARADLGMWADEHTPRSTPWSPLSPGCKTDLAQRGQCWCGKLRNPREGAHRA